MNARRVGRAALALVALGSLGACGDDSGGGPLLEPELRFMDIAAGARHTCALDTEGLPYCWGYGFDGQTGLGGSTLPFRPRPLGTSLRFASIETGSQSTCAVERAGAGVYCWGVLGGGSLPALIGGSEGATDVALTVDHACVRFDDGSVGCFGANDHGQLGPAVPPGPDWAPEVVVVPGVSAIGAPAVGHRHSCALADDGTVSCWGLHEGGQLGIGATTEECPIGPAGEPRPCAAQPTAVASGPYMDLVSGLYHTCALEADGTAACWGDDQSGQLGLAAGATEQCDWLLPGLVDTHDCERSPAPLAAGLVLDRLDAGYFHTCGIEGDGEAQCWGTDAFSQTGGLGRPGSPGLVAGALRWGTIASGQLHTCGLTDEGVAYCWGDGQFGQLGSISEFAGEPILVTGS